MKKLLFLGLALLSINVSIAQDTYEYQIVTVVESIVPNGLGRSRMITANETRDYKEFTSTRTGEDDKRNKSDRGDIRVKGFDETKLLNFFNLGGIRFQNIAANDALVMSKINTMASEGWELAFVNSGVEGYAGKGDKNGIYITRYTFKRKK
ncbi:hypothetical protein [Aquimarina algicola]|uniref:DUF4177 domain-containing protein n=1 Tax=Aquimarina algicola TaxID=2589995 RepID=A0A504JBG1_9FLAO|nr:hypothetical protein [Aquimarina algicola]TPN85885.1 hypothetical protein FHK87_11415 [Aquimarina algicola]